MLSDNQHGFCKGRSCFTALAKLTQDLFNFIGIRNGRVIACFIDLKKAFDTVPHDKLLCKLKLYYGLDGHLLKIIGSYLKGRNLCIKIDQFISKDYHVERSVPQGSNLGPLLFILYIDDICSIIDNISYLFYADDLIIYFSTSYLKVDIQIMEISNGLF